MNIEQTKRFMTLFAVDVPSDVLEGQLLQFIMEIESEAWTRGYQAAARYRETQETP